MTPTVSVVLNCYNHAAYVGEAIESVLAQTYRNFELILIDNGSTDGSRRMMQSYTDERIRLILHDDNQSISKRLNEGVAAARGEFVSILYSDDLFLPDKLERQLAIFAAPVMVRVRVGVFVRLPVGVLLGTNVPVVVGVCVGGMVGHS